MRKRAQLKSKPVYEELRHFAKRVEPKIEKKSFTFKKNWWVALSLILIFFLVLFFNTYFNLTSEVSIDPEGEGFSKYYLSGPDPYYNMRLVQGTYETGVYPYYSESDPLLNYPIGARGGRAPLLNMMALGFSRLLTPFMDEIDAIGYSMQFIPALFGALLIFPVYYIGKELFNKKAGLIGAMFIAIIPIHLGSGHGSAFALFDHDSFNLLLFFLTFMFLILSIREKNRTKSILYAILGGVPLAALSMVWVEAQYLYVVIAIYAVVQMFIDMFTNKIDIHVVRTSAVILFSGYLISLPVLFSRVGFNLRIELFLSLAILAFGIIYYVFGKKKIPWTISIPSIFSIGFIALVFLYFVEDLVQTFKFLAPMQQLSQVIFGTGIYGKKVSMTIAEANTYQISQTVMSFGPSLYWLAWAGFVLLMFYYYKNKQRKEYLFIIVLFLINIWLAGTAGRFLNDMVPLIAILGGWVVWVFVDWLDYKQMIRNIKSAGGGFHGLRKGIKFLHIFGILFIAFLVVLPSAFVAFDAAVPNAFTQNRSSVLKIDMFGEEHQGAFGLGVGKERYWVDAFNWLSEQDTDIEDPNMRPAFISWWDYGFYESAIGNHPTVADNFQDGIPAAGNFHTATGEREAVAVLSTRLMEGDVYFSVRKLSDDVREVLIKHVGDKHAETIESWLVNPSISPSYGDPIGAKYDEETSQDYTVGQQYAANAVYHDIADLLLNNLIIDPETNETVGLTDEELTWFYHDLQEVTGYSVRYYGVEGYDRQIFNIFGFLSDKSLLLVNGIADDYIELVYKGYTVDEQGNKREDRTWSAPEILGMSDEDRRYVVVTNTEQVYKDPYFETMFYRVYIGPSKGEPGSKQEYDWQIPCLNMKHFYAEYMSDLSEYPYYGTGKSSVVIAKYYEGAILNGTVTFLGEPVDAQVAVMKNLTYYSDFSIPIDHDTDDTDEDGAFDLIAGAGDVFLQIRTSLGEGAFILKNVSFSDMNDSNFAQITDDDAMRMPGSNFNRLLNITIDPAELSGNVYEDIDDNGVYNESIDEPLSDLTVTLYKVTAIFQQEDRIELDTDNPKFVTTDKNGQYQINDLIPGIYRLVVTTGNYNLHLADVTINEGINTYNAPNAKLSALDGVVFIDEDGDDTYDSGEELSGVDIELLHLGETVGTYKTDSSGSFSFDSLIPGKIDNLDINEYILTAVKALDYEAILSVYPEANETTTINVSIGLSPVIVSGIVTHGGTPMGEATIDFVIDESVENNTADDNSITTESDGTYEIELSPGNYNISIIKYEGGTPAYILSEQQLEFDIGQGTAAHNFQVEKISVTVTGATTYGGNGIVNVTVAFEPVTDISAALAETISDKFGMYTLEVSPGNYTVEAISDPFVEGGKNYTYRFTGQLEVKEENIVFGKTFDIVMSKVEF